MPRPQRFLPILTLFASASAFAVFPDSGADTSYTSVGRLGFGSGTTANLGGVAIDPFWVLTAEHVGSDSTYFFLEGERYNVVQNVVPTIVDGRRPDLRLLRVDRAMPNFTRVDTAVPETVTLVGFGQTRTEQPGGYSDGFGAGTRRAATNRIEGLEDITFSSTGEPYWTAMYYNLSAPGDATRTTNEGGIADQDSGSGWFSNVGGERRLVGISSAVDGPSPNVSAYSYGGLGYGTYLGDGRSQAFLRQYVPQAVVPEPASMAALGLGALALLRRRKR